jgi:hypothetical protein
MEFEQPRIPNQITTQLPLNRHSIITETPFNRQGFAGAPSRNFWESLHYQPSFGLFCLPKHSIWIATNANESSN